MRPNTVSGFATSHTMLQQQPICVEDLGDCYVHLLLPDKNENKPQLINTLLVSPEVQVELRTADM
jgi:hypothetical protein